jgi:predicted AlkP superfamily pyrophosphatase or phosphodiesterase
LSNNRNKNVLLMIFLDAFSQTYLSKKITPFLYSLANEGISTTVDTVFAFRGVETTMFTGVWPNVHGSWTEFKLAEDFTLNKKVRIMQGMIKTLDTIPSDGFRAKSRFFVERYLFKRMYSTPNIMPPQAIPYFKTTQLKETVEEGSLGEIPTIFDVFRKKGIPYHCFEPWIRGDKEVFNKAQKMIKKNEQNGFWYLKFSHLDHLGHKFGPDPTLFKGELIKIDNYVMDIVNLARKGKDNMSILIVADHGMSRVHSKVDIADELSRLHSRMYKDYLVFVDSTIARFWFFNDRAMHEVSDMLNSLKCGHVISAEEKEYLHIPLDVQYGELLFALDEGFVNHPSFFNQKSEVKGMHGYAYSKTPESRPILIIKGIRKTENLIKNGISHIDISCIIMSSFFPGANYTHNGLSGYLN